MKNALVALLGIMCFSAAFGGSTPIQNLVITGNQYNEPGTSTTNAGAYVTTSNGSFQVIGPFYDSLGSLGTNTYVLTDIGGGIVQWKASSGGGGTNTLTFSAPLILSGSNVSFSNVLTQNYSFTGTNNFTTLEQGGYIISLGGNLTTTGSVTLGALAGLNTINNSNWSGTVLGTNNGGTGTNSPALVAGSNITITGTWPNQTINSTSGGGGTNYLGVSPIIISGTNISLTNALTQNYTFSGTNTFSGLTAFTGTADAITQTTGTSNTNVATTAFVAQATGSLQPSITIGTNWSAYVKLSAGVLNTSNALNGTGSLVAIDAAGDIRMLGTTDSGFDSIAIGQGASASHVGVAIGYSASATNGGFAAGNGAGATTGFAVGLNAVENAGGFEFGAGTNSGTNMDIFGNTFVRASGALDGKNGIYDSTGSLGTSNQALTSTASGSKYITPTLSAGANTSVTGSWPNWTVASSGGGGGGSANYIINNYSSSTNVTGTNLEIDQFSAGAATLPAASSVGGAVFDIANNSATNMTINLNGSDTVPNGTTGSITLSAYSDLTFAPNKASSPTGWTLK